MSDFEILGMLVLTAGAILLSIVVSALLALLGGWVVMLGLGDLHHVVHQVPAVGYLGAFVVVWGLGFLGSAISRGGGSFVNLNARGSSGTSR